MRSDRIAAGIKTVYEGNVLLGLSTASKVVSHLDSEHKRHSEIGAKLKEKLSERKIEVLRLSAGQEQLGNRPGDFISAKAQ